MYNDAFADLEKQGKIRRPIIPADCTNNAHMLYMLFNDLETRTKFIAHLKENGVYAPFHYIPLHSAPAGEKYCRTATSMNVTNRVSDTLVRLPMYYDITDADLQKVIDVSLAFWK